MNKKAAKILAFILLLWPITHVSRAESFHAVMEFNEADAIVLSANMLMNGSMGGTGAYLTAHPNAGLKDFPKMLKSDIYWRGFGQGMIGGSLVYTGMKTMTMQPEFEYSVLAGKQISDLGTSIAYSASENQNWLENPSYMTDIGPMVLHWRKTNGWKPNIYILPGPLFLTIDNFAHFNFEPELSLKTGLFVFSRDIPRDITMGYQTYNNIIIDYSAIKSFHPNNSDFMEQSVIAHEASHTRFGYFVFMPTDAQVNYGLNRINEKSSCRLTNYLTYDQHPVRIGADLSYSIFWQINNWTQRNGTPEDMSIGEYPSYHLPNYKNY